MLHTVGQFYFFALVEFCVVIISVLACASFFFFLVMLGDLYYFYFCFSCSGWGIGPCGGVVEPDLVAKMRSDEVSGDNFFYGPSVMVPYREPFANECYSFGDSQYHSCGYTRIWRRSF
jgi:hypothetical protein